jgi:hypothetical protein
MATEFKYHKGLGVVKCWNIRNITGSLQVENVATSCGFAKMKKAEPYGAAFAFQVRGFK